MKRIYLVIIAFVSFLSACSFSDTRDIAGMLDGASPEVETRFRQSIQWNETHGCVSLKVPESYHVFVCADSHINSASTTYLQRFFRAYRSDTLSQFILHLGDLLQEPRTYNRFMDLYRTTYHETITKNCDTLFIAIGNHDLFFGQWKEYRALFHTSVYWFETVSQTEPNKRLDLYICLDSGEGSLGKGQIEWLEELLAQKSKEGYRHIIVFTHTPVFYHERLQGLSANYPLEETTALTALMTRYGVSLFMSGHEHLADESLYGGVKYLTLEAQKTAGNYCLLQVENCGVTTSLINAQ
ncbi:MAG: metallophosphoesterase [Paludibacteraceae bacterium]|nr:metallophosphoesterase [Paludibacteraceae bacterium]